jgi:uncharacterized membrane protein
MIRLAYALVLGLVGAGIVHLCTVLIAPMMANDAAWNRISTIVQENEVSRLQEDLRRSLSGQSDDPFFETSACRFDLSEGVVTIQGPTTDVFWSLSIYDRSGTNVFSYNESASKAGLDLTVVRHPPSPGAQKDSSAVVSTIDTKEGLVLIRVFVPDEQTREKAKGFLHSVTCH